MDLDDRLIKLVGAMTRPGYVRSGDVKRLKGVAGSRPRIGDWRVIFIEDARSITVVAVGNRKEIYD